MGIAFTPSCNKSGVEWYGPAQFARQFGLMQMVPLFPLTSLNSELSSRIDLTQERLNHQKWFEERLRSLTPIEVRSSRLKGEESIANTLKEQCSKKLLTPLFAQNLFPLPNGKDTYDVKDAYVPDNNVQLLGNIYETIV